MWIPISSNLVICSNYTMQKYFNHVGLIQTAWMQKKRPSKCFIKRSYNIHKKIFPVLKTLEVKIVYAKLKLETMKKEFSGNGTLSKL